jgi:hypothetical protein
VCKLRVSCLISRRYRIRKYDGTCFGSRYELDTDESDGFQIDSLLFVYGTLVEQYLFLLRAATGIGHVMNGSTA